MTAALAAAPPPPQQLQGQQRTAPSGPVRVAGRAVADDRGSFPALGASLFWAAWAYKHDRPRLDAHLQLLARHDFDYIRVLGTVGRQPYWKGREIDWRWPDYPDVIAGLTDYAFDRYGIRVQWTIFGDAEQMIPDPADRVRLVDRFVAMSAGRERKIMMFEVANESWQNGFSGLQGIEELRSLARRLDEKTTIPVAVSDSEGHECGDHQALYAGLNVQVMTDHFARDVSGAAGPWAPVLAPWGMRECAGLPSVISNNEPIGPGSSVEAESSAPRIAAAAVVSWMAGVGLYVFHTDAGVWGREPIESLPGVTAALAGLKHARGYVPPDLPNWISVRGDPASGLFAFEGARELLVATKDREFFAAAIDVGMTLTVTARQAVLLEVVNVLTGEITPPRTLRAGEKVVVERQAVVVIRGRLL